MTTRAILFWMTLGILSLAGCDRSPTVPVFKGTLYTYAPKPVHREEMSIGSGMVLDQDPPLMFFSDKFWERYTELNPNLSEAHIAAFRAGFSISEDKTFRQKNCYFTRWFIRIKYGDQSMFESLCIAYSNFHRFRRYGFNRDGGAFLRDREEIIRAQLNEAIRTFELTPSDEQTRRVETLEENLAQLKSTIENQVLAKELEYPPNTYGRIAEHLMKNSPLFSAGNFVN